MKKRFYTFLLFSAVCLLMSACTSIGDGAVGTSEKPVFSTDISTQTSIDNPFMQIIGPKETQAATHLPTQEITPKPSAVPAEAPTPAPDMPETAALTEVLRAGIGSADNQLGIDMSVEGNVPEAFSIFDDSVAILDSVKQRVCIYENGALARTIDLTQAHDIIYGYSMARQGCSLFVHDAYSDTVFEFDYFSGEIKNSFPVPEELCENDSCNLFEIDGSIYVGARRSGRFMLKNLFEPDASAVIRAEETADNNYYYWSTPFTSGNNHLQRNENKFYYFINSDSFGNAYFEVCDLIPDMEDYIFADVYLLKCSSDGEIIGYAGFQNELEIKLPHRHTLVLEDGIVYEMMCTETEVVIYEVTFGSTYESRVDELREYYRIHIGID